MTAVSKPLLLLTNDDGFFAPGIQVLAKKLKAVGEVFIVAPDREKSASSLSLTLRRPLRAERIRKNAYAVDGTPADCIYLAMRKLLPRLPRLILSGINAGPNLGRQDISYSGTVAAALQGAFLEIPSLAVSQLPNGERRFDFAPGAEFIARLAERLLASEFPPGLILNINFPPPPFKGLRITELGEKRYEPEVIEKADPREKAYYWIGLGNIRRMGGERSDIRATEQGLISITPLTTDRTDRRVSVLRLLQKALQDFA